MAYVPEVSEEQADAGLRQSYEQIKQEFGFLPHFWQVQGSRPEIVRASVALWRLIYRTGVLPPALKEQIGLVVSAANSDSYCIVAHLELLHRLGVDKALGKQLVRNYEATDLPEREKALFRFAEKVTRTPFKIKEPDVAELRRQGWDDATILETSLVASHFNFLNRLAAALGLVPEHVF
ncbi:MAG: carboxymuconolactone decarboxylase family protein [Terriglobia bacterium]